MSDKPDPPGATENSASTENHHPDPPGQGAAAESGASTASQQTDPPVAAPKFGFSSDSEIEEGRRTISADREAYMMEFEQAVVAKKQALYQKFKQDFASLPTLQQAWDAKQQQRRQEQVEKETVLEYQQLVFKLQVVYSRDALSKKTATNRNTSSATTAVMDVFAEWLLLSVGDIQNTQLLADCITGDCDGKFTQHLQLYSDRMLQKQREFRVVDNVKFEKRLEKFAKRFPARFKVCNTMRMHQLGQALRQGIERLDEDVADKRVVLRRRERVFLATVSVASNAKCCNVIYEFLYTRNELLPCACSVEQTDEIVIFTPKESPRVPACQCSAVQAGLVAIAREQVWGAM